MPNLSLTDRYNAAQNLDMTDAGQIVRVYDVVTGTQDLAVLYGRVVYHESFVDPPSGDRADTAVVYLTGNHPDLLRLNHAQVHAFAVYTDDPICFLLDSAARMLDRPDLTGAERERISETVAYLLDAYRALYEPGGTLDWLAGFPEDFDYETASRSWEHHPDGRW